MLERPHAASDGIGGSTSDIFLTSGVSTNLLLLEKKSSPLGSKQGELMRYVKILSLLAVVAAAAMAFAATASATTLTSPTGTTYTGTIHAHSEGATELVGSFSTVKCGKSTVHGLVERHGTGVTAGGKITAKTGLTFEECNFAPTVLAPGELEVHAVTSTGAACTGGAGTYCTGTLTSKGAKVKVITSVGECVFDTGTGTHIGVLTPTNDTKGHATLDINSSNIPRTEGNFLCGTSATWKGSYTITTPSTLWINP